MRWLWWFGTALCLSPIWGALLWEIWEGAVRPRLISSAEIDALSTSMLARHEDGTEEFAFIEEDRAWRYSESFEQGRWRRVRKRIERMRSDASHSPKERRVSFK